MCYSAYNVKILITGSNGFIGRKIAERFINQGVKVAALDRKLLTDPRALKEYVEKVKPSYIFHLAAYGNDYNQSDVVETISTNYMKTFMLLEATKDIKYKAFLNFSTSSVYGTKFMPMSEIDKLEPTTFYSATKAGAELLCRAYAFQYNKPIVSVRPFSVTGVGEQRNHLIPTLIRSALSGKKMPFVKDPTHDFVDVYDLVDAVLTCSLHGDVLAGTSINIGSGKQYANHQVKGLVEELTGKKIKVEMKESMREYDNDSWVSNNDRINAIGWKPTKPLKISINEMIDYAEQISEKENN